MRHFVSKKERIKDLIYVGIIVLAGVVMAIIGHFYTVSRYQHSQQIVITEGVDSSGIK